MHSLKALYRIGNGPSSSHSIGPYRAASLFLSQHPDAFSFRIFLYGSLAATGKGHLTDKAIQEAFYPKKNEILWNASEELPLHPNGMRFEALDRFGHVTDSQEDYSIGGGALLSDGPPPDLYPFRALSEIMVHCEKNGISFWEYVINCEGEMLWMYLNDIWKIMGDAINRGLNTEGLLPGKINLYRKARSFFRKGKLMGPDFSRDALLAAYAYAVAEENAAGNTIVTAPTCGSSGILPAVLFYLRNKLSCNETDVSRALATAGLFGNIVKSNGSISGAAVGCQGEVGTACAMAAAAATQLLGGTLRQIEYAAEMGLEHHFGLTCDPVAGLVQIPCIERNAHAATRALTCSLFALLSDGLHRISFDDAVLVLMETGQALPKLYRETSTGGLAKIYENRIMNDL